jgi:hypothetical protein
VPWIETRTFAVAEQKLQQHDRPAHEALLRLKRRLRGGGDDGWNQDTLEKSDRLIAKQILQILRANNFPGDMRFASEEVESPGTSKPPVIVAYLKSSPEDGAFVACYFVVNRGGGQLFSS